MLRTHEGYQTTFGDRLSRRMARRDEKHGLNRRHLWLCAGNQHPEAVSAGQPCARFPVPGTSDADRPTLARHEAPTRDRDANGVGAGPGGCGIELPDTATDVRNGCANNYADRGCDRTDRRKQKSQVKVVYRKCPRQNRFANQGAFDYLGKWTDPEKYGLTKVICTNPRPVRPLPALLKRCSDVTSYDYNWNNDMLCTRPDGSTFYTSYEGANVFMSN